MCRTGCSGLCREVLWQAGPACTTARGQGVDSARLAIGVGGVSALRHGAVCGGQRASLSAPGAWQAGTARGPHRHSVRQGQGWTLFGVSVVLQGWRAPRPDAQRLGCYHSSEQNFVTSHYPGAALAPSFPERLGDGRSVGIHFAITYGYCKNPEGSYSMEYEVLPTSWIPIPENRHAPGA